VRVNPLAVVFYPAVLLLFKYGSACEYNLFPFKVPFVHCTHLGHARWLAKSHHLERVLVCNLGDFRETLAGN